MRKITIRLTDEEYAAIERQAQQERRSVREQIAYLATRSQQTIITIPSTQPATVPYINPFWPPKVICDGTSAIPPANGTTIWNG